MPLYGCLDDRHMTPSSHQMNAEEMIWGRPASLLGWKAYLGEGHPDDVSAYAAPARAEDLSGLPPAYMMVGELDLMRDENIDYAMRRLVYPPSCMSLPVPFTALKDWSPRQR
jgi:acetyl esterase/lipase